MVSHGPEQPFRESSGRYDDEPQVGHRDVQQDQRRLIPAVRSCCASKSTGHFSVQLPVKPQATKAVSKSFQLG